MESLPCLHEKFQKVTKRLLQNALSIAARMYVEKGVFYSHCNLWALRRFIVMCSKKKIVGVALLATLLQIGVCGKKNKIKKKVTLFSSNVEDEKENGGSKWGERLQLDLAHLERNMSPLACWC